MILFNAVADEEAARQGLELDNGDDGQIGLDFVFHRRAIVVAALPIDTAHLVSHICYLLSESDLNWYRYIITN